MEEIKALAVPETAQRSQAVPRPSPDRVTMGGLRPRTCASSRLKVAARVRVRVCSIRGTRACGGFELCLDLVGYGGLCKSSRPVTCWPPASPRALTGTDPSSVTHGHPDAILGTMALAHRPSGGAPRGGRGWGLRSARIAWPESRFTLLPTADPALRLDADLWGA